jgi:hypothetical protein
MVDCRIYISCATWRGGRKLEFVGNNAKKCLKCGVYCVQHGKGGSNLLGVIVL